MIFWLKTKHSKFFEHKSFIWTLNLKFESFFNQKLFKAWNELRDFWMKNFEVKDLQIWDLIVFDTKVLFGHNLKALKSSFAKKIELFYTKAFFEP